MPKSYQSEYSGSVVVSSASIMALQLVQGGIANVSEAAFSAFAVGIVSFILRQIQKHKDKKNV